MTRTEIERVAGGLSEAQREWLLSMRPTLDEVAKEPCAAWWDNPGKLYVEIDGHDYWLGSKGMISPADSAEFTSGFEKLSPLGIAVRNYILEQDK